MRISNQASLSLVTVGLLAAQVGAAERLSNPYEDIKWDETTYIHSFSHQHNEGVSLQKLYDMGYRHLPISDYYPSKPRYYPLPDAFERMHSDVVGAPNAEHHSMTDSVVHFCSLGSYYSSGYGCTPKLKHDIAPIEYAFDNLHIFDPQHMPWIGVYRLDVACVSKGGTNTTVKLTVEDALEVRREDLATVGDGIISERPLAAGAYRFLLRTKRNTIRVRIDFSPETTRITQFRLMQGTNRPWKDAFRATLDGSLQDGDGRPVEGLLYSDAGGITINHPKAPLDEVLAQLDFDERVLGIEVWNHMRLFGYAGKQEEAMRYYNKWDGVLRTGRRCFGFFAKDHCVFGRGRNVLLLSSDYAKMTRHEREREALRAYRHGHFFGLIGAMSTNDNGKVCAPYDYSTFRFTRIAVQRDSSGKPVGLDASVDGADRTRRPNTQIRFITDEGPALSVNADQAFFAFQHNADGSLRHRYVRAEAFAYPNTCSGGKPLTAEALTAMNVYHIARLHDRCGDISETNVDRKGNEPIGVVDMIFSQPILVRNR